MTPPPRPAAAEERLRASLSAMAEEAMARTHTDAELRRFRQSLATQSSSRRRRWVTAAAASAVLALGAGAAWVGTGSGAVAPVAVAAAGTFQSPVPLPGRLVEAEVGTHGALGDAAHPAAGFLWYVADQDTIDRIDPDTGVVTPVRPGVAATGPLVEAGGRVWFAGRRGDEQRFFGLDPRTGRIAASSGPVSTAGMLAAGPSGLWAVTGQRELRQLDERTGRVLRTVATPRSVHDVHVGTDVVYAGAGDGGNGLTVVDPVTGRARTALPELAPGPLALAPDGDVWVQDLRRPALVRFDGTSLEQEVVIPLPGGTSTAAQREYQEGWGGHVLAYPVVVGNSLYAVMNPPGQRLLLRADARTGVLTHVFETGRGNFAGPATVLDGSLWIAARHTAPLLRRIAPVR